MWLIVYSHELGGWCLIDWDSDEVLIGPYGTHADIVEAAQTRAFRLSQGWKP